MLHLSQNEEPQHRELTSRAIADPTRISGAARPSHNEPFTGNLNLSSPCRPLNRDTESDTDSLREATNVPSTPIIGRPFSGWTFEMEGTLFRCLCTQAELGNRADSGFRKEAWNACVQALLDGFEVIVSVRQCKTKVDNQKSLWKEFNWLKNQPGFDVNEAGLIEASEGAWTDICAQKGKLSWHKSNKLNFYEELTTLFQKSTANGTFVRSSIPTSTPILPYSRILKRDHLESDTANGVQMSRKKSSSEFDLDETIKRVLAIVEKKETATNIYQLAINLLQDEYEFRLSENGLIQAIDLLQSESHASTFVSLKGQLRDLWLCRKAQVKLLEKQ